MWDVASGVGQALREVRHRTCDGCVECFVDAGADTRIVIFEPARTAVISRGEPGRHSVEGTGIGFIPPLLDADRYDEIQGIEEADGRSMARRLSAEEGLLAGTSTGLNVRSDRPRGTTWSRQDGRHRRVRHRTQVPRRRPLRLPTGSSKSRSCLGTTAPSGGRGSPRTTGPKHLDLRTRSRTLDATMGRGALGRSAGEVGFDGPNSYGLLETLERPPPGCGHRESRA